MIGKKTVLPKLARQTAANQPTNCPALKSEKPGVLGLPDFSYQPKPDFF